MRLTDKDVALFYGITRQTVINYRKGSVEKNRLYLAMVKFYKEYLGEQNGSK